MGSMELCTAPENGTAAAATACNGGAAPPNGGVERRLRSMAASASWAAHLPLEVGTRVMCRWRDQKPHPVKVIERRKSSSYSSPADYEYYVHYTECKQPPTTTPSGCFVSRVRFQDLQVGEFGIKCSIEFTVTVNQGGSSDELISRCAFVWGGQVCSVQSHISTAFSVGMEANTS
jgi:hypothetical protein